MLYGNVLSASENANGNLALKWIIALTPQTSRSVWNTGSEGAIKELEVPEEPGSR